MSNFEVASLLLPNTSPREKTATRFGIFKGKIFTVKF